MAQGAFINNTRPRTKKALREACNLNPASVSLEATAVFPGAEHDGPVLEMPEGKTAYVVGPDPYRARNWYAQVTRSGDKVVVK
jgi:hypothetical protein